MESPPFQGGEYRAPNATAVQKRAVSQNIRAVVLTRVPSPPSHSTTLRTYPGLKIGAECPPQGRIQDSTFGPPMSATIGTNFRIRGMSIAPVAIRTRSARISAIESGGGASKTIVA